MPKKPVATLSPKGWAKTPAEICDAMMAHASIADKSQTSTCGKFVTSIPWIFEEYGHNIPSLIPQLQNAMETYFSRIFDAVNVNVSLDPASTNVTSGRVGLTMTLTFIDGGKLYSLGNLLSAVNGKFVAFEKILNNGAS
jgi:hypothetical protein